MSSEVNKDNDSIISVWSSSSCRFTVMGDPSPQARQGIGRGGNAYDPSKAKKLAFRSAAQSSLSILDPNVPMFDSAALLSMFVEFRMRRPDSHFVSCNRESNRLKSTAPSAVLVKRCDVDNLLKFVMDALNTILYEDDRQVAAVHAFRLYDNEGRCEGSTTVCIDELVSDRFPSCEGFLF
jgi:Holliday junction resolvase RusA-like endonuclease